MKEFVDKLSQYDFLNHIVPGSIFLLLLDYLIGTSFQKLSGLYFLYLSYIIGIVIGRFGSFLFKTVVYRLINDGKKRDYKNYANACEKDSKIDLLVTSKNMYRNLSTTFLLTILIFIGNKVLSHFNINFFVLILTGLALLCALFVYSSICTNYYIDQRIENALSNKRKKTRKSGFNDKS